jgi:hypothetical protein
MERTNDKLIAVIGATGQQGRSCTCPTSQQAIQGNETSIANCATQLNPVKQVDRPLQAKSLCDVPSTDFDRSD